MEQTKTNTPPQWVKDMQAWQEADTEHRSVLCIASKIEIVTEGVSLENTNALFGSTLPIALAIAKVMEQNEKFKELIKSGVTANESEIARTLLESAIIAKHKPEPETEKKESSNFADFLKNLFS